MKEVVGVCFDKNKRIYFFDSNGILIQNGDNVIVDTERGIQFGKAVTDILKKNETSLNLPLKKVLRVATDKDLKKNESNIIAAKKAFKDCNKLIDKHNLNMKLIDACFTFEREQLIFHFLSDSRIDFRILAKDLAGIYKTRIELRQIGVRDKAKEISGIGPCGRTLCCSNYLVDFDTVSINMAKNQNLSLNPTKINGVCGRLLCCLTYENEVYEEYRKYLPNLNEKVKYKGKEGKVVSLDILNKKYTIQTNDDEYIEVCVDESSK